MGCVVSIGPDYWRFQHSKRRSRCAFDVSRGKIDKMLGLSQLGSAGSLVHPWWSLRDRGTLTTWWNTMSSWLVQQHVGTWLGAWKKLWQPMVYHSSRPNGLVVRIWLSMFGVWAPMCHGQECHTSTILHVCAHNSSVWFFKVAIHTDLCSAFEVSEVIPILIWLTEPIPSLQLCKCPSTK